MNSIQSPKILPWIARQARISDELATKLWRRAASEATYLTARSEGPETWRRAIERFLDLVTAESGTTPGESASPLPRLTWMWRHHARLSSLSLIAAENTCRYWQNTWMQALAPRKAA